MLHFVRGKSDGKTRSIFDYSFSGSIKQNLFYHKILLFFQKTKKKRKTSNFFFLFESKIKRKKRRKKENFHGSGFFMYCLRVGKME